MSLLEDALEAFDTLKQACMSAPVLDFTYYTKGFLLETDASKEGLGAVLSQKQADGQYHPVAYGSRALMAHEKKIPFHQAWVPSTKVGSYGAFQRVLAVSTIPSEDWQ